MRPLTCSRSSRSRLSAWLQLEEGSKDHALLLGLWASRDHLGDLTKTGWHWHRTAPETQRSAVCVCNMSTQIISRLGPVGRPKVTANVKHVKQQMVLSCNTYQHIMLCRTSWMQSPNSRPPIHSSCLPFCNLCCICKNVTQFAHIFYF